MAEKKTDTLTNPVWLLRNAPIIDWLDPTIKIQQVHLPNLKDDLYFQKVPKVDRCHTCHTFIDKPGYEDQPQPFTTHPRLHLFAGSDSPLTKRWVVREIVIRVKGIECMISNQFLTPLTLLSKLRNGQRNTTGTRLTKFLSQCFLKGTLKLVVSNVIKV